MKIFLSFSGILLPKIKSFLASVFSRISELLYYALFSEPTTRQFASVIRAIPPGSQVKAKIYGSCLEIEIALPS